MDVGGAWSVEASATGAMASSALGGARAASGAGVAGARRLGVDDDQQLPSGDSGARFPEVVASPAGAEYEANGGAAG